MQIVSFYFVTLIVTALFYEPQYLYYKFKAALTPEEIVQEIQCGNYTIQEVKNDSAVTGTGESPTPTRIETYSSLRLNKDSRKITFKVKINEEQPLVFPILSGFEFGNYRHQPDTQTQISHGTFWLDSPSQNWFVDADEVNEVEFAALAKCLYTNKKILESVSPDVATYSRIGREGEKYPIRGIFRLTNAEKFVNSYIDVTAEKKFSCNDQGMILVTTPSLVIWRKMPKSFLRLAIKSDGSISLDPFPTEKSEKDFFNHYDLTACVDENKVPITKYYVNIVSKIQKLYTEQ